MTALRIWIGGLVLVFSFAAEASPATSHVREIAAAASRALNDLGKPLADRERTAEATIRAGFDGERMARFSLGRFWPRQPSPARSGYIDAYQRWASRKIRPYIAAHHDQRFSIEGERPSGRGDVTVATAMLGPADEARAAAFRVRTNAHGPLIVDVVLDGTSIALAHRAEFTRLAKRYGLAGLTLVLEARAGRLGVWP